jgi:hypothetical protein
MVTILYNPNIKGLVFRHPGNTKACLTLYKKLFERLEKAESELFVQEKCQLHQTGIFPFFFKEDSLSN